MIHQNLTQRHQLRILPQQIQLLNIFHLSTVEMEQRIRQEIEENPLLEELEQGEDPDDVTKPVKDFADWEEYAYDDVPDYRTEYANYFSAQQLPERPLPQGSDFRSGVKEQLRMLTNDEREYFLGCFLADSLNENGLLDQDLITLAEDVSFSVGKWMEPGELERPLALIQSLDPPGLGARNLRECLLLQLGRKDRAISAVDSAYCIIDEHYTNLNAGQLDRIMARMGLSAGQLRESLEVISTLSLKPVEADMDDTPARNYIVPDLLVTVEDDGPIEISLARQRSMSLVINRDWMEKIRTQCRAKDRAADQFLQRKLQSAEWFLSAIAQRETTMIKVMRAIVQWQQPYFRSGDPLLLRPMILQNIAEIAGVDISTVSRITSNKYAATPFGNILLKELFAEGLPSGTGEAVSSRVIQHALKEIIEQEDKNLPFSDHQLVRMLAGRGYTIARRTVAKYRELLRIPAAHLRTIWK